MLVGTICAQPQPLARTCCCHDAGGGVELVAPAAGAAAPRARPVNGKFSCMMTGTGPAASAGVVSVSWISTVTAGYDELSTWPTSVFVVVRASLTVLVTSQRTRGVSFGVRP